jgi:hypothetical protein
MAAKVCRVKGFASRHGESVLRRTRGRRRRWKQFGPQELSINAPALRSLQALEELVVDDRGWNDA